jgi:hypothetical protein
LLVIAIAVTRISKSKFEDPSIFFLSERTNIYRSNFSIIIHVCKTTITYIAIESR